MDRKTETIRSSQDEPCKRCKLDNKTECSNGTEMLLEQSELVDDGKSNEELEMVTLDGIASDRKEDGIEIPTLVGRYSFDLHYVLETFFEWLEDVELLKTCRLVNKYWDSLACASLRIYAVVKPRSEQMEEFHKCLELRLFGDLVPSPFMNVHAEIGGKSDVLKLARLPNLRTSGVYVCCPFELGDIPIINQFLKSVMKDLTWLHIYIWHESLDQVLQDVKLPSLKSLIIPPSIHRCVRKRKETLKLTLETCELQRLEILFSCSPTCTLPLLTLNFSRLVELTLDKVPYETFQADNFRNYLENLKIPSLKTLKVNRIRIDQSHRKYFNAFLNNFAAGLIELHIHFDYSRVSKSDRRFDFTEMIFPKLKVLSINPPEQLFEFFSPEIFPSLTEVYLKKINFEPIMLKPSGQDSLTRVRLVHISFDVNNKDNFLTILPKWMLNLTRTFPNVENFGISGEHAASVLRHIYRAYPNLKCFRIQALSDFLFLFGTCQKEVDMYLNAGKSVQDIPQRPSLFSFKELESLALRDHYKDTLTHDTFQHGVSRLTNVKNLECSWHHSLSAKVVARSLQHVKKLKIVQDRIGDSEMKDQLTELKRALPGCEVIHKKY